MKCNMEMINLAILVVILILVIYYYKNSNEKFSAGSWLGINVCEFDSENNCKYSPKFKLGEFDKNKLGGVSTGADINQTRTIKVIAFLNEDKKFKEAQYFKNKKKLDDDNREAITLQMLDNDNYSGALETLQNIMINNP